MIVMSCSVQVAILIDREQRQCRKKEGENMTIGEFLKLVSADVTTRTLQNKASERQYAITDDWKIAFIDTLKDGSLVIYCERT
jgi:hypothetical protein